MTQQPTGTRQTVAVASAGTGMIAAVITCSDSKAAGTSIDVSGPLAVDLLRALGHRVADSVAVVPDEPEHIEAAVRDAIARGVRIVVTTGGTGAGPRDVTPEALRGLGLRELPGLGEAMRAASRPHVPAADLSRALGGVVGGVVVLALPGSPGGVRDGLAAVGGLIAHAAEMAAGGGHGRGHRSGSRPTKALGTPVGNSATGQGAAALVRDQPITEAEVVAAVSSAHAGAVVTFAGVVRDHDHGRPVTALQYEAHPDAGAALAKVLTEARARPGVLGAAALHRVGDLAIGDLAFVTAISAAHRGEAFAACAWLVDEVKARLPVWKHQHFADGTDEWVNCA